MGAVLDLGHAAPIAALAEANGHLVSQDTSGAWALWDLASKAILATGSYGGTVSYVNFSLHAAGSVFAVSILNGVELRDAGDGHVIASIPLSTSLPLRSKFGLATDGSYLWTSSTTEIQVWSPTGALLFTHPGNYSTAVVFGAPSQLQVGSSASQTIEYIDATSGSSTLSATFSDTFFSWFADGGRFFTSAGTTIRIYSATAAQEALTTVPNTTGLTGYGSYFFRTQGASSSAQTLQIYTVTQPSTPLQSFSQFNTWTFAGNFIAAWAYGSNQSLTLLRLDAAGITSAPVTVPSSAFTIFGADVSGNWSVGNANGVVYDSASIAASRGALSCGKTFAITAGTTVGVAGTDGGGTLAFGTAAGGLSLQRAFPFKASFAGISQDATILAVQYADTEPVPPAGPEMVNSWPDNAVHVLSLPGGTEISSFPVQQAGYDPALTFLSLAAGGTMLGKIDEEAGTVTNLTDTTTSFSGMLGCPLPGPGFGPGPNTGLLYVSPDGTLAATTDSTCGATQIYKNGTLVDAATGFPSGWLDNDRLLIQFWGHNGGFYYKGTAVHTVSTSTNGPTTMMSCTQAGFGVVDATHVFCPGNQGIYDPVAGPPPTTNAIYDITTGAATWTGSSNTTGIGAVVGGYVLYANDHHLYVEAHP